MFESAAKHAAYEIFVRIKTSFIMRTQEKKTFKTCHLKFRRYFSAISVPKKIPIQELVEKVRETSSVVDKKIKSLGYYERKSVC